MNMVIYCDGGSRGNPGSAASAFVVIDDGGNILHKENKFIGIATNNTAEYQAVIMAFEWLVRIQKREKFTKVVLFMDSELVINQLRGVYKVKNHNLLKLFNDVKLLEKDFDFEIVFKNVPREKNKLADFLVNKSLNETKTIT